MGRNFLYRTMQLFLLVVLLSPEAGATGKKYPVHSATGHIREQYTATIDHCGEIELTGAHTFTGNSQQNYKKASLQLWCANNAESETIAGSELYIIRMQKARGSIHLAYIFPFHHFW